jgi:hypothetical protein
MTIIITKKQTKKEIEEKLRQASSNKEAKGLKKHFGLSIKNIDADDFQKKVRNEWD